jgi:AP-3 complex subunit sigma
LIFNYLGEKKKLIIEKIYKAVEKLNDKSCNFFEDFGIYDGQSKIVARKYATLFFILVIDEDESELGILDLI